MRRYLADLHVHSVLSPCAAPEMLPLAIIADAASKGLDMVAICDHNAAENIEAVQQASAAVGARVRVFAGIEVTTCEECHVLGLFPTVTAAAQLSASVRTTLPTRTNGPKWMGPQLVVDANGRTLRHEEKMLAGASTFGLSRTVALIHELGGLAIAAHVDRPSFSVTSQLGLIAPDTPWDALEVSGTGVANSRMREFETLGFPLITGSDAHSLDELGCSCTYYDMDEPTFEELSKALRRESGRGCFVA